MFQDHGALVLLTDLIVRHLHKIYKIKAHHPIFKTFKNGKNTLKLNVSDIYILSLKSASLTRDGVQKSYKHK